MNQTIFHDLPQTVLAALLDHQGPCGRLSPRPLMGPASCINKQQLAELYAGHFIELPRASVMVPTAEFSQAAKVVLNPSTNITLRLWGEKDQCAETTLLFRGDLIDGPGVVLNQLDRAYRLVSAVGIDELITMIQPAIPTVAGEASGFDFDAHFDGPVAATLFGVIDWLRLNRDQQESNEQVATHSITADQLSGYLSGQWGLSGFEQLISYIAAVGLMPTPPSLNEVEYCLELLVSSKQLNKEGECHYSLSESLHPLVNQFSTTVPGLQWQRLTLTDRGELLVSHRTFIFGDPSLILSFSPTPQGRIFIATTTAEAMIDFLVNEMTTVLPRSIEESQDAQPDHSPLTTKSTLQTSPHCEASNHNDSVERAASNLPINNSTAIKQKKPSALRCMVCDHTVDLNNKFCTHCGAVRCDHCSAYVKKRKLCSNCKTNL